ncbi:hypothetical protein NX059_011037 [Plenodomus lindquistii]|nr:hypothetical protein NX059_011037 [Plenodomus lindquistii]
MQAFLHHQPGALLSRPFKNRKIDPSPISSHVIHVLSISNAHRLRACVPASKQTFPPSWSGSSKIGNFVGTNFHSIVFLSSFVSWPTIRIGAVTCIAHPRASPPPGMRSEEKSDPRSALGCLYENACC